MAVKIQRHQIAIAIEEDNDFSIGHGRGRGKRASMILANALGNIPAPEQLAAGAIERGGLCHILGRVDAREEEVIFPNDGRCRGGTWQIGLPGDVLGLAPFGGQAFLVARSIETGPTPLRPILSRNQTGTWFHRRAVRRHRCTGSFEIAAATGINVVACQQAHLDSAKGYVRSEISKPAASRLDSERIAR